MNNKGGVATVTPIMVCLLYGNYRLTGPCNPWCLIGSFDTNPVLRPSPRIGLLLLDLYDI
jgi:hypothetical protein